MPIIEIHAGDKIEVVQTISNTILAVALNKTHPLDMQCGGAGTCRSCRVFVEGTLCPPTDVELAVFSQAELASGLRLACQARIVGDVKILHLFEATITQILGDEVAYLLPQAPRYKKYGLAVDIGTTTLAACLFGTAVSGKVTTQKNPQTYLGSDVITRVERALAGEGEELAASVQGGIIAMAETLADDLGISLDDIDAYVLTGNTVMLYLLCGNDPTALSCAPFEADRLFGETLSATRLGLPNGSVYLPRCISAFVGADMVTAILATGMCERTETTLMIDIGTNGEIALWDKRQLTCCSTAAGPAFEGAGIECGVYAVPGAIDKVWGEEILCSTIDGRQPVGICGSGIIDAVACMLDSGVLDETGAIEKDGHALKKRLVERQGQTAFQLTENIVITAEDVRKIQLAKGAIRAGVEALLHHAGVSHSEVTQLYIAGGFGNFINLSSAARIGLIPPALLSVAAPVGNAALRGAAMLLQDVCLTPSVEKLVDSAQTLDLCANDAFREMYMEHMML